MFLAGIQSALANRAKLDASLKRAGMTGSCEEDVNYFTQLTALSRGFIDQIHQSVIFIFVMPACFYPELRLNKNLTKPL